MTANQKIRNTCFVIEGLNSFATILYFNCLYFFMQQRFGFSDKGNLALAALLGLTYTFAAWQGGKFAHRFGYFTALKIGFSLMAAGLVACKQLDSATGVILAAIVTNIGMCLIWPTLEALVSESETPAGVPRAVGIYNIVWAVTNAAAFFIGVTLVKKIGFNVIIVTSIVIVLAQLALTFWMEILREEKCASRRARGCRRAAARSEPSVARAGKGISAHGVAGESVRLHRRQHAHRRHSRPRREIPCRADVRGIRLVTVVFRPARRLHRAVALDGLALSLPLAGRFVRGPHFVIRSDSVVAEPRLAHRRANLFRRRHRADLLLVAVLLDGRRAPRKASTAASTKRRSAWATASARRWARRRCNSCRNTPTAGRLP